MIAKPLILLFLFLVTSCSFSKKEEFNKAAILDYYYEFIDNEQSDKSRDAIAKIKKEIEGNTYIITHSSGNGEWPYYLKVENPTNFPKDSIMIPHPGLHYFSDINTFQVKDSRQFQISTTFYRMESDTVEINVKVLERNITLKQWNEIVDVGVLKFNQNKFTEEADLVQFIKENIILISFK